MRRLLTFALLATSSLAWANQSCTPQVYTAEVNGSEAPGFVRTLEVGEEFYLPADFISEYLAKPPTETTLCDEQWVALSSLNGDYQIDPKVLNLRLVIPPLLLRPQRINNFPYAALEYKTPENQTGFALDYSFLGRAIGDSQTLGMLLDTRVFFESLPGFGRSTFTYADFVNDKHKLIRRETAWEVDYVDSGNTLVIGDTASSPYTPIINRSFLFGGVSYGTNWQATTRFEQYNRLNYAGVAQVPTTVDLYIDNVQAYRAAVDPGPFELVHVPQISGTGQASIVITDELGQQQIIDIPLYNDPRLLAPGVHHFQHQGGFLRENFGINNFDYGDWFLATAHSYGVSDQMTLAGEVEVGEDVFSAGGSVINSINSEFTLAVDGRLSYENDLGAGYSVGIRLDNNVEEYEDDSFPVNYNLFLAYTDDALSSVAQQGTTQRLQGTFGLNFGRGPNFGINYIYREDHDGDTDDLLDFRFDAGLNVYGFSTSIRYTTDVDDFDDYRFALNISSTFGTERKSHQNFRMDVDADEARYSYRVRQRTLDNDARYSANIRWGDSVQNTLNVNFNGDNEWARYNATAAVTSESAGLSLGIGGGIVAANGYVQAASNARGQFVILEVPDAPGIRADRTNPLRRTDEDGRIALVVTRPYVDHTIELDKRDLPIGATGKLTDTFVVGRSRGIYHTMEFGVNRQATVRVQSTEAGRPIPVAARGVLNGEGEIFVGRNGLVFVDAAKRDNELVINWDARGAAYKCVLRFAYPVDTKDPLPDLGVKTCTPEIR